MLLQPPLGARVVQLPAPGQQEHKGVGGVRPVIDLSVVKSWSKTSSYQVKIPPPLGGIVCHRTLEPGLSQLVSHVRMHKNILPGRQVKLNTQIYW